MTRRRPCDGEVLRLRCGGRGSPLGGSDTSSFSLAYPNNRGLKLPPPIMDRIDSSRLTCAGPFLGPMISLFTMRDVWHPLFLSATLGQWPAHWPCHRATQPRNHVVHRIAVSIRSVLAPSVSRESRHMAMDHVGINAASPPANGQPKAIRPCSQTRPHPRISSPPDGLVTPTIQKLQQSSGSGAIFFRVRDRDARDLAATRPAS